ncbi:MAG: AAA family ATPase [Actinomycetia bacterium]|nr:AAA family ATPase [Actinomycetes bacterium]
MGSDEVSIGRRVVVTGLAGSGKSTFSRALAAKTGLPAVPLDLHYWKPGWVAPTPEEWRQKQRQILAAGSWIADGNYHETLALRLERADTVVIMDTPWTACLGRALVRGLRRPGIQMPEGCDDTAWRRFRDEWGVAWRVFRRRRWEPQLERRIISQHGQHASVHVLASKPEAAEFLIRVGVNQAATEDD